MLESLVSWMTFSNDFLHKKNMEFKKFNFFEKILKYTLFEIHFLLKSWWMDFYKKFKLATAIFEPGDRRHTLIPISWLVHLKLFHGKLKGEVRGRRIGRSSLLHVQSYWLETFILERPFWNIPFGTSMLERSILAYSLTKYQIYH